MAEMKKVRVQLLNPETNAVVEEVNVLTSPDCVIFDDGKTLTDKISEGLSGGDAATVNGHTVESNVPADAVFTDTIYEHPVNHAATMIVEDETHRFVTDEEKELWNTEVTKEALGLENVTNDAQVKRSEMGVAGGVATLDEAGKISTSQLPSYVDDVLEYDDLESFPEDGESGKIYVAIDTNKTYRWSGSAYVEISASLALGETSSTAYAGDKGKANAEQIALNTTAITKNAADITAVNEGLDELYEQYEDIVNGTATVAKAKDAETVNGKTVETSVPADAVFTDTTYELATETTDGLMNASDKAKLNNLEHIKYGADIEDAAEIKLFFKVV